MEFFFLSFFIINFLPLGLNRAEFLLDSVEVGLLCTWSWQFSLAAARDGVLLWSVGAVVLLLPPLCTEHWGLLATPASVLAGSL